MLFFAAVLPQFVVPGPVPVVVPGPVPVTAQVAVLGLLDVALGFVIWGAVVGFGVRLSTLLRRASVWRWWDRVTGAALGALGGGLLVTRNA